MELMEAKTLVAMLLAAYPRETLEPASVEVYAAALAEMGDAVTGREAVATIVRSSPKFPSISEIRSTYLTIRERTQPTPLTLGWKREMPEPGSVPHRQMEALAKGRDRAESLGVHHPLGVVMLQWEELLAADVPIWSNPEHMPEPGPGVLDPHDRLAIRQRFPEWRTGKPLPDAVLVPFRLKRRALVT